MAERFPHVARLVKYGLQLPGSSSTESVLFGMPGADLSSVAKTWSTIQSTLGDVRSQFSTVAQKFGLITPASSSKFYKMIDHLGDLHGTWLLMKATLVDAENLDIEKEFVKTWLHKVKDLVYVADNVLDSCEYELLHAETEQIKEVHSLIQYLLRNDLFRDEIPRVAELMHKRIHSIGRLRKDLGLKERDDKKLVVDDTANPLPTSGSLQFQTQIFGREDDEQELLQLLQSNVSDQNATVNGVHVVAVVGMGGLGKTTLVQKVYNNDVHFDMKGWVCVSVEYDLVKLTKAILESFTKKHSGLATLSVLQEDIQIAIRGKRFLLVLDDIWNNSYDIWENIFTPLRYGAEGSKVLITTRNYLVADAMRVVQLYRLNCLSDEDSWLLFQQCALDGDNLDMLGAMRDKVVKKCGGLPLALKVLGRLVWHCKQDRDKLRIVLDSDMWNTVDAEEQILGSLKFSYLHLPTNIKPCFRLCAMFSKDQLISKEDLVCLWMAHDLILPVKGKELKDIGMEYINELSSRSFFQIPCYTTHEIFIRKLNGELSEDKVVMHDLIHDLALYMSEEECQTMVMVEEEPLRNFSVSSKALHITVNNADYTKKVLPFQCFSRNTGLYTLITSKDIQMEIADYKDLKYLRVLSTTLKGLPDCIGNLKHLRYLNLSRSKIKALPKSISELYHLQTLDLSELHIKQIPNSIGNLKQLRHLNLNWTKIKKLPTSTGRLCNLQLLRLPGTIRELPKEVGMLTNLRCLDFLPAWENVYRRTKCASLAELQGMVHLKELAITNLYKVRRSEDGMAANLGNKRHIHKLILVWNCRRWSFLDREPIFGRRCHQSEEEVLEKLKPHANLETLEIMNYGGLKLAEWLGDLIFVKLVSILLVDCSRCTSLTPLELLPSLKNLRVYRLQSLTEVCCEEDLVANESLEDEQRQQQHRHHPRNSSFPSLEQFWIWHCHSLTSVRLYRFSSLRELSIERCSELVCIECQERGQDPCSSDFFNFSLKVVNIYECPSAVFHPAEMQQLPSTIQTLRISHSPLLEEWCEACGIEYEKKF